MRPARLSYTRINELHCPFRYQALNIRGVKDRPASYTSQGKQLHEIGGVYIKRLSHVGIPRSQNLLANIFLDHTKLLSAYQMNQMKDIIDTFGFKFTMPRNTERNVVEYEMAVTRQGKPLPISEAIHPDGLAKIDCFTGIADYLGILTGGERAFLWDWKMGNQLFDMFEAQKDRQLQGYSYLHFKNDPRCVEIIAHLFAPKFNQYSSAEFKRKRLVPDFEEWLAGWWKQVDELRNEHPIDEWPAIVHFEKACTWCRETSEFRCPKKEELRRAA